ncbi:PIR Superfamily Protein [Plasmodium ovale wallikeri]|uniref:PIR Superfamily Protein n=1 Tax=Plasmodium ovale wallikeri TaxID=864142 RepID=A0A1A9ALU3_PLAOA|nr:PIR Superfamily Protein [Plasmodium ovale wallikeri]SBT57736.1 PIR Superfamily Protein [Plasmodium ovale wallikeri]
MKTVRASSKVSKNDLPSVKFDKEIKDIIQYSVLEGYLTVYPSDEEINEWISQFKSNMEQYLAEPNWGRLPNRDKRCRDFYYITNDIKQKILMINGKDYGKKHNWKNEIEHFSNNYFFPTPSYKCEKISLIYDNNMKMLDDFCEDSAFIKGKLDDIQNSVFCQIIFNEMFTRKGNVIKIQEYDERKQIYTEVYSTCSTKNLDIIYQVIDCNSTSEYESKTNDVGEADTHVVSQELGGAQRDALLSPIRELLDDGEESLIMTGDSGENNTIGLVSLPIFGVLALSFLLYKYTPLGSKFHNYFRNNKDISIKQDYEETDQILSNTSKLNDTYSENMEYNLSYQTL